MRAGSAPSSDWASLYVVTSVFTLAKCVRDRQEEGAIVSRVDQARLDKLLVERDLLRVDGPGSGRFGTRQAPDRQVLPTRGA